MVGAPKTKDATAQATAEVEVVYALPNAVFSRTFQMPIDGTLIDAVRQSGLLDRYPEVDISAGVGVYGRLLPTHTSVRACQAEAGERVRVEVYRPLKQSPVEARRRRQTLARLSPKR